MCDNYANWPNIEEWIHQCFPNLQNGDYEETSDQTCLYNCIAWAAEDIENWWWPSEDGFWPLDTIGDESVENFEHAFQVARHYEVCTNGNLEDGIEKVAIFAIGETVKHMARQLITGEWTSKLGIGWDIRHPILEDVNCPQYGVTVRFLARPRGAASVSV